MFLSGFQAENDPIAPSRGIPREDIKVCGVLSFKQSRIPNLSWIIVYRGQTFHHVSLSNVILNN